MKLNKKGFTLIELLAVIVILAIIALVATPIIINVIDDAKKKAALTSANNVINAINTNEQMKSFSSNSEFDYIPKDITKDGYVKRYGSDGNELQEFANLKSLFSGDYPDDINVLVQNSKVISGCMIMNGYNVSVTKGAAADVSSLDEEQEQAEILRCK